MYMHTYTDHFNGHFLGKLLVSSLLDSQTPLILILSVLVRQTKTLNVLFDTILPGRMGTNLENLEY